MGFDRRMLGLLVLLAVIGVPALALRLLCIGHACDEPATLTADVPFCSLPEDIRRPIAAGFRESRSPEVLGVTSEVTVAGGGAFEPREPQPQWPSAAGVSRRIPLLIAGDAVTGRLPAGAGLEDIAPTVAELIAIERPHPEVRSGRPIEGLASERPVPLAVQIVWKGVGSVELEADPAAWPGLVRADAGERLSLEARSPSLPLDPAAVLTTIGTGGLPAQHGITGSLIRTDDGDLVEPWGRTAPVSVIAALGDDLDELTDQQARVGLIAEEDTDRGLIGADWYVRTDRDDVEVVDEPDAVVERVEALLGSGYGSDDVPDLLGITLEAPIGQMDRTTEEIIETVTTRVDDAVVVVTATGSSMASPDLTARDVARHVESQLNASQPAIEATAPGGLFLDQEVVATEAIQEDRVLGALRRTTGAANVRAFADTFPAIAISFGRYC